MFLFFKASKRGINIISWSYFQTLKTWILDSCPDKCPNVIFQEIVDNVKCGRDAPCRPQISIPAIWGQTNLFSIPDRPPTLSAEKIKFQKIGSKPSKPIVATSKAWIQFFEVWSFRLRELEDRSGIGNRSVWPQMTFQIAGIDTCGLQGASRPH